MEFNGIINCLDCGAKTPKSFNQGLCYRCFVNSPLASPCIIRPELCEAHLGKGRDLDWEIKNHLQTHHVYLSLTSGVKVGVTRSTQVPTRWIDQGATQAVLLATTPNRYLSGKIEVLLKEHLADKTNWRIMLRGSSEEVSLDERKTYCKQFFPLDLMPYYDNQNNITTIDYPVEQYPEKVTSINLDKINSFELKLLGIKGQYLIFENNKVINIRKYGGYNVKISVL